MKVTTRVVKAELAKSYIAQDAMACRSILFKSEDPSDIRGGDHKGRPYECNADMYVDELIQAPLAVSAGWRGVVLLPTSAVFQKSAVSPTETRRPISGAPTNSRCFWLNMLEAFATSATVPSVITDGSSYLTLVSKTRADLTSPM